MDLRAFFTFEIFLTHFIKSYLKVKNKLTRRHKMTIHVSYKNEYGYRYQLYYQHSIIGIMLMGGWAGKRVEVHYTQRHHYF